MCGMGCEGLGCYYCDPTVKTRQRELSFEPLPEPQVAVPSASVRKADTEIWRLRQYGLMK